VVYHDAEGHEFFFRGGPQRNEFILSKLSGSATEASGSKPGKHGTAGGHGQENFAKKPTAGQKPVGGQFGQIMTTMGPYVSGTVGQQVPRGSRPADGQRFATAEKLECSEVVDGVIYCSIKSRRGLLFFIEEKWLLEFYFEGGQLDELVVKKGLTGP